MKRWAAVCAAAVLLLVLSGCETAPGVQGTQSFDLRSIDPPAAAGALAPNLTIVGGNVAATWLEPVAFEDGRAGHRLRFALHHGNRWADPVTVAEGDQFFANWADIPSAVEMGSGDLLAHWLAKTAPDTYAYSIFLARSQDGGASWESIGRLNSDETATEHGFARFVVEGLGARAFWLDGRAMADGGPMALRTAWIGDAIGPEQVLDDRTCECCATDAAVVDGRAVVVYRDRSEEEIRDVAWVRASNEEWTAPAIVSVDGWRIEGCPVNGPALAGHEERAVAAWFAGARDRPSVQLAFSENGGSSFAPSFVVDDAGPIGRVDVVFDHAGTAWVTWLASDNGEAEVRLQGFDEQGVATEALTVARTSPARASGFPRLAVLGNNLYIAWVDVREEEPQRLRVREVSTDALSRG